MYDDLDIVLNDNGTYSVVMYVHPGFEQYMDGEFATAEEAYEAGKREFS